MSEHLSSVKLQPTISYKETISLIFGRVYVLVSCNVQNLCVERREVTCNMLHFFDRNTGFAALAQK
jgi:hypothetical protein